MNRNLFDQAADRLDAATGNEDLVVPLRKAARDLDLDITPRETLRNKIFFLRDIFADAKRLELWRDGRGAALAADIDLWLQEDAAAAEIERRTVTLTRRPDAPRFASFIIALKPVLEAAGWSPQKAGEFFDAMMNAHRAPRDHFPDCYGTGGLHIFAEGNPRCRCGKFHAVVDRDPDGYAMEYRAFNEGPWTLLHGNEIYLTEDAGDQEIARRNEKHPQDGRRIVPIYTAPPIARGEKP